MFSLKVSSFFSTRRAFRPPAWLVLVLGRRYSAFRLAEQAEGSTYASEATFYLQNETSLPYGNKSMSLELQWGGSFQFGEPVATTCVALQTDITVDIYKVHKYCY